MNVKQGLTALAEFDLLYYLIKGVQVLESNKQHYRCRQLLTELIAFKPTSRQLTSAKAPAYDARPSYSSPLKISSIRPCI